MNGNSRTEGFGNTLQKLYKVLVISEPLPSITEFSEITKSTSGRIEDIDEIPSTSGHVTQKMVLSQPEKIVISFSYSLKEKGELPNDNNATCPILEAV